MSFDDDKSATEVLDYFERWTTRSTRALQVPIETEVTLAAVLYRSLIRACRPERYVACSDAVQERARRIAADLGAAYDTYLRARLKMLHFDDHAFYELAHRAVADARWGEAVELFETLASASSNPVFAAWAHYARGLAFAEAGSVKAARAELELSLKIQPTLIVAKQALEYL